MNQTYVHGYHPRENERLQDQAGTLVELLHADTAHLAGSTVLEAGLDAVRVSPRMVYVDSCRPDLVDGFTCKTFTAMVENIREPALAAGLIEPERFDTGVRDLHRTAEADGVFCCTFFKGLGENGLRAQQFAAGDAGPCTFSSVGVC